MIPTLRVDEGVVPDRLIEPLLLMAAMTIDAAAVENAVEVIQWEIMKIIIIIAPLLDIITREDTMTGEAVAGGGDIAVEVMDMTKMAIITITTNILRRGGGEDFVEKGLTHP